MNIKVGQRLFLQSTPVGIKAALTKVDFESDYVFIAGLMRHSTERPLIQQDGKNYPLLEDIYEPDYDDVYEVVAVSPNLVIKGKCRKVLLNTPLNDPRYTQLDDVFTLFRDDISILQKMFIATELGWALGCKQCNKTYVQQYINNFFEKECTIMGPGASSWRNAQRNWVVILTNRAESLNILNNRAIELHVSFLNDKLALMVNGKYFEQWYKEVVERQFHRDNTRRESKMVKVLGDAGGNLVT